MRIQIIGAGLAGCSVAAALSDRGHEVSMFDTDEDYSAWAICTGKVFAPKSDGKLAERLLEGLEEYESDQGEYPLFALIRDTCVDGMVEVIKYKNPKQAHKRLLKYPIGDYVKFDGVDILVDGYHINIPKAVSVIRSLLLNGHLPNPELTIYCRGAWERDLGAPFKIVPVRGTILQVKLSGLTDNIAFHWPHAGLYYVPSAQNGMYSYGTVMVPDVSMDGVQQKDIERLLDSDNSYIMADWIRAKYDVKISMAGARESASAGYRPWARGYVPGYFAHAGDKLWVNGLYQSGAQLFFWIGHMVADAVSGGWSHNLPELNVRTT